MAEFLLVEDDDDLRGRLSELIKLNGHSVVALADGRSTVEVLDNRTFDVLIFDWDLPDTTAIELCRHYRKSGGEGAVLILTGRCAVEHKVEGLRAGADDYLTKPFVIEELLARLEALLRRSKSGRQEKLDDLVGKVFLDRYRITSILGKGGMGIVYKAEHIKLSRTVAIKVMLNSCGLQGGATLRFEKEARAMSLLNHSGLVGISDFGTSIQGHPYIVMEYLEGHTLQEELSRHSSQGLHPEKAVSIFIQIADALSHAHNKGIVHRDLKPGNVMLVDAGNELQVKIVDLGLVKFIDQLANNAQALSYQGEVFGSPFYMSPEQATGGEIDARCDIYSLGCLMFEVLTGEVPLAGTTFIETVTKRMTKDPIGIREACPSKNFSKGLEQVVLKAMARNNSDRYSSMSELSHALQTIKPVNDSSFFSSLQGFFKRKK